MQNKLCENSYKENFREVSRKMFEMTCDLLKEAKHGSEEMRFCIRFLDYYENIDFED